MKQEKGKESSALGGGQRILGINENEHQQRNAKRGREKKARAQRRNLAGPDKVLKRRKGGDDSPKGDCL